MYCLGGIRHNVPFSFLNFLSQYNYNVAVIIKIRHIYSPNYFPIIENEPLLIIVSHKSAKALLGHFELRKKP